MHRSSEQSIEQSVPASRFRIVVTVLLAGFGAYLTFSILAGIFIADASLKLHRLPLRHQKAVAAAARDNFHAVLQDVSISASDGVVLKGWYVHPRDYNGNAVILLHGITDNREGVAGYGRLLLEHVTLSCFLMPGVTARAAESWRPTE